MSTESFLPPPAVQGGAALFAELESSVHSALCTYSNVHRGSGHFSEATTHLYEQARRIVLDHLGLDGKRHVVIFCSPRRADALTAPLASGEWRCLSSVDLGLPLGIRAVVVDKRALRRSGRIDVGGGTARLIAADWVVWARGPDRFEAGTPSIINVIAFARALQLIRGRGDDAFKTSDTSLPTLATDDELGDLSGRPLLEALRESRIGRDLVVPTLSGDLPFIHLDNSASTPTFAAVWGVVREAWRLPAQGRRQVVEQVKESCARFLGVSLDAYEVVFSSNSTEAINLAAGCFSREAAAGPACRVLSTSMEHSSNDLPWRGIPGASVVRVPFDERGFVDLPALEALLACGSRIDLVALTAASNVMGAFNDLEAIGAIVRRHGARLLVDAAQAVPHRRIDMQIAHVDYLAFSAHKMYAPFGCGVLVVRKGLLGLDDSELARVCASGEENVGGIAALGKVLELMDRIGMDVIAEDEKVLTTRLLRGLAKIEGVSVHGFTDPDAPGFERKLGVIAFSVTGHMAHKVGDALAQNAGIGVRWGCHCAHVLVKRVLHVSPFLEQFQRMIATLAPGLRFPGVARVSLGLGSTEQDIDRFLRALADIAAVSRSKGVKKATRVPMDAFTRTVAARVYPG